MTKLQALFDIEAWLSLTVYEQDAVIREVAVTLESEFFYEGMINYSFIDSLRIPTFRHLLTGLEMNMVIGGTFNMGLSENEEKAAREITSSFSFDIELMRPTHTVQIQPFLMTKFPILDKFAQNYIELDENLFRPEFGGPDDVIPVYLTRNEIRMLSDSLGFCLPSESQWEYAYRAKTETLFYFGNSLPEDEVLETQILLCNYSNYQVNQKAATPFGFVGMCIGEWCEDSFAGSYDVRRTNDAPLLKGPPYVVRGGAAALWPWQDCDEWTLCMSAMRSSSEVLEDETCGARLVKRLQIV